jgi:hypothetical protein
LEPREVAGEVCFLDPQRRRWRWRVDGEAWRCLERQSATVKGEGLAGSSRTPTRMMGMLSEKWFLGWPVIPIEQEGGYVIRCGWRQCLKEVGFL